MKSLSRREVLQMTASAAAFTTIAQSAAAQPAAPGSTLRFFPGFTGARVKTTGAEINLVHAG